MLEVNGTSMRNALVKEIEERAEFMEITPQFAKNVLRQNRRNRKVRRAFVEKYKRDMVAGKWKSNGQPIVFDKVGGLLDGQHRLTAVAESSVTIRCLVVMGADPSSFDKIDIGARRGAKDMNEIVSGQTKHGADVASAKRYWVVLRDRDLGAFDSTPNRLLSTVSDDDWLHLDGDVDKDLRESVAMLKRTGFRSMRPTGLFAALHAKLKRGCPRHCREFFTSFESLEGLSAGSSVAALHRVLGKHRPRFTNNGEMKKVIGAFIKAWNAYVDDRPVKRLTVTACESLPTIVIPKEGAL